MTNVLKRRPGDEVPDDATSRFDGVFGDDGRGDKVEQRIVGNEVGQRVTRDRCVCDTALAPWLEPVERKCERRKRCRVHDVTNAPYAA